MDYALGQLLGLVGMVILVIILASLEGPRRDDPQVQDWIEEAKAEQQKADLGESDD